MGGEPMSEYEQIEWVRLLIDDPETGGVFDLSEIRLFLATAGHPLLAAADALDVLATSEVRLSKKITTQDLETDGPAVAAELRKQAAALRDRYARQQAELHDDAPVVFAFRAPQPPTGHYQW